MERVVGVLTHLRDDPLLQDDLQDDEVKAALAHWTGRARLARDEAERRFNDNYKVQQTLRKLQGLQQAAWQSRTRSHRPRRILYQRCRYHRPRRSRRARSSQHRRCPPGLPGEQATRAPRTTACPALPTRARAP